MYTVRNFKPKNGKSFPCLVSIQAGKETGVFPAKNAKLQNASQVHIIFYIYTHTKKTTNQNYAYNQSLVLQSTTVKSIIFKQPQNNSSLDKLSFEIMLQSTIIYLITSHNPQVIMLCFFNCIFDTGMYVHMSPDSSKERTYTLHILV